MKLGHGLLCLLFHATNSNSLSENNQKVNIEEGKSINNEIELNREKRIFGALMAIGGGIATAIGAASDVTSIGTGIAGNAHAGRANDLSAEANSIARHANMIARDGNVLQQISNNLQEQMLLVLREIIWPMKTIYWHERQMFYQEKQIE